MTSTVAGPRAGVRVQHSERRAPIPNLNRLSLDKRFDLLVFIGMLAAAVGVTIRYWLALGWRMAPYYESDPAQHQWFLAHALRVITHGENPFFTYMINYPDGVNLMANTSILGLGIPLAPVTWAFGPATSLTLVITLGLAGTAFGWYWVLSRHVVSSRWAAAIGGAFCGFAPPLISHANWHSNFVAQFVVPFIVWQVFRLGEHRRALRNGAVLGLLVSYQAFINEEILLFTALACGVFVAAWAIQHRDVAKTRLRTFITSLSVALFVAATLLAYPLWIQFFGPQHYGGLLYSKVPESGADVASFVAFSSESLSGNSAGNASIALNYAEENTFFGWPLLLLISAAIIWMWRDKTIRALAVTAAVFAALSLGSPIQLRGESVVRGPWGLINELPIMDSVLPSRFGLVVVPVVGAILAIAIARFMAVTSASRERSLNQRGVGLALLAVALIPILPTPVSAVPQAPVPEFVLSGQWKNYLDEGQTLVPAPLPEPHYAEGMRWAAAAHVGFAIPRGYFLMPHDGIAGAPGQFGASPRPTAMLLNHVAATGEIPIVDAPHRRQALVDLKYWNAGVVVLDPAHPKVRQLRITLSYLLGHGTQVGGTWIWDVGKPTDHAGA